MAQADSLLKIVHDDMTDTLYITRSGMTGVRMTALPGGIELDADPDTGEAAGATVLGFRRNGWRDHVQLMTSLVAVHLRCNGDQLFHMVYEATRRPAR